MQKTVSILGCGWLGLPLGAFLKEKGFSVRGSTTREEKVEKLKQAGITPFVLNFTPHPQLEQLDSIPDFLKSEVLVIAIPPQVSQQGENFHPMQMMHLSEHLKIASLNKIIYISSTSVYPDINKEITEDEEISKETAANHGIRRAEEILSGLHRDLTILRCGGLMGYDRIPGKYFAGKKELPTGEVPVNFVHRDDVIHIIYEIIKQDKWNKLYNVVAPQHPVRKDIYLKNAEQFGLEPPQFTKGPMPDHKIVKSDKLVRELNYNFLFENPLDFTYEV